MLRCCVSNLVLATLTAGFIAEPRRSHRAVAKKQQQELQHPFSPSPIGPLGCGVLAICDAKLTSDDLRLETLTLQRLVRHRGPDGSGIHVFPVPGKLGRHTSVAHERLAVVDPLSGNQPLYSHDWRRQKHNPDDLLQSCG